MGLGGENRENSGETITLSMLCRPVEFEREMKRNVETTHDKHA